MSATRKHTPVTPAERIQIGLLHREGKKLREIAALTDRPFGTVATVVAKMVHMGDLEPRGVGCRFQAPLVPWWAA